MRLFTHHIALIATCLLAFIATACQAESIEDDEPPAIAPIYVDIELHAQAPIIAHRGYWTGNQRPANSLAAFEAALQLNIYGSECDIRQTADGVLVVCHDATHDGLRISRSTYDELRQHPLANSEPLPRLEELIQTLKMSNSPVRLVLDIKECDIYQLLAMVEGYGVADRVLFIAFNRQYCNQLVRRGRGPQTFYLNGNMSPRQVKDAGYAGIDYSTTVLETHPQWIGEAAALGLKTIVWTVNNKESIADYISQGCIVTTDRPLYVEL